MLGFKSVTVFVFIFSLLCINHNAVAQTVVSLQFVSTGISTDIDINNDGFGSTLFTGTFVSKEFGINQLSFLVDLADAKTGCTTSLEAGNEDGAEFNATGNLIINVPSKDGKNGISQLRIDMIDLVCVSLSSSLPNFSAVESGTIAGGTGIFAGATGSITGVLVGTFLQADEGGFFFTASGSSTLTLDD